MLLVEVRVESSVRVEALSKPLPKRNGADAEASNLVTLLGQLRKDNLGNRLVDVGVLLRSAGRVLVHLLHDVVHKLRSRYSGKLTGPGVNVVQLVQDRCHTARGVNALRAREAHSSAVDELANILVGEKPAVPPAQVVKHLHELGVVLRVVGGFPVADEILLRRDLAPSHRGVGHGEAKLQRSDVPLAFRVVIELFLPFLPVSGELAFLRLRLVPSRLVLRGASLLLALNGALVLVVFVSELVTENARTHLRDDVPKLEKVLPRLVRVGPVSEVPHRLRLVRGEMRPLDRNVLLVEDGHRFRDLMVLRVLGPHPLVVCLRKGDFLVRRRVVPAIGVVPAGGLDFRVVSDRGGIQGSELLEAVVEHRPHGVAGGGARLRHTIFLQGVVELLGLGVETVLQEVVHPGAIRLVDVPLDVLIQRFLVLRRSELELVLCRGILGKHRKGAEVSVGGEHLGVAREKLVALFELCALHVRELIALDALPPGEVLLVRPELELPRSFHRKPGLPPVERVAAVNLVLPRDAAGFRSALLHQAGGLLRHFVDVAVLRFGQGEGVLTGVHLILLPLQSEHEPEGSLLETLYRIGQHTPGLG